MTDTVPASPLTLPSYRWYLASMAATFLGSELTTLAVQWRLFELTRDPLSLGMIGLAGALPFLGTVLFAGHLADVCDRRKLAAVAMSGLVVCTLVLMALSWSGILDHHIWLVYVVVACISLARSFLVPARGALASDIVAPEQREQAARLRSTVFQIILVSGRAGGGFVYAGGIALGLGAGFTFAVSAALLLAGAAAMLAVRTPPQVRSPTAAPVGRSLLEGITYLGRNRILLGAMLLDLLGVLFGDAIALAPMFADQVLHIGPEGLGLLRAAPAAGAVLTALILARLPAFTRAGPLLLGSVAGFGLSMVGFALATSPALAVLFLVLGGGLDFISVTVRGALLQVMAPPQMLGRLTALQQVFIWTSNEIGAFESGLAARLLGLVPSVVAGGLVTVGVTGVIAWASPALRRLGRIRETAPR